MAKQTHIRVNGVWRKVVNVWIKIDGIWKQKVIPKGRIDGVWKEFMSYYQPRFWIRYGAGVNRLLDENYQEIKTQATGVTGQTTIWAGLDENYNLYVVPYLATTLDDQYMYKLDADLKVVFQIDRAKIGSQLDGYGVTRKYWHATFYNYSSSYLYDKNTGALVKGVSSYHEGSMTSLTEGMIVDNEDMIYRIVIRNFGNTLVKIDGNTGNLVTAFNGSINNSDVKLLGGKDCLFLNEVSAGVHTTRKITKNLGLVSTFTLQRPASVPAGSVCKTTGYAIGKTIFTRIETWRSTAGALLQRDLVCYDYQMNELWRKPTSGYESNADNELYTAIDKNENIYLTTQNTGSANSKITKFTTQGTLISTQTVGVNLRQFVIEPSVFSFPDLW